MTCGLRTGVCFRTGVDDAAELGFKAVCQRRRSARGTRFRADLAATPRGAVDSRHPRRTPQTVQYSLVRIRRHSRGPSRPNSSAKRVPEHSFVAGKPLEPGSAAIVSACSETEPSEGTVHLGPARIRVRDYRRARTSCSPRIFRMPEAGNGAASQDSTCARCRCRTATEGSGVEWRR